MAECTETLKDDKAKKGDSLLSALTGLVSCEEGIAKKCTDCKYCLGQNFGYSNYTVEGTGVDCLLDLNPGFPADRFYGEEPTLLFAAECPRFTPGECVSVDCEQEDGDLENYSDDPEVKELLKGRS